MDWGTVIGSAAVAAVTSSVITELGRVRERKSRREELALAKAVEIAQSTYAGNIELMKLDKFDVKGDPQTMMIRDSYRIFKHLLDYGVLDPLSQKELDEEIKADAAREQQRRPKKDH